MEVPDAGGNALMKVGQMEFLVRRVNMIVRQSKTHQSRWQSEYLVKGPDGGIGATRTHEDRHCAEAFVASRGDSSY